jgi:hypothetical protein
MLEVSKRAIVRGIFIVIVIVIVLGGTLNVDLLKGGYYPYLLIYYGSVTSFYIDVLQEASAQARG